MTTRHENFVNELRDFLQSILYPDLEKLNRLVQEWDSQNYSGNINDPGKPMPDQLEGFDINKAEISAAITSLKAIQGLLSQGHHTNLMRMFR